MKVLFPVVATLALGLGCHPSAPPEIVKAPLEVRAKAAVTRLGAAADAGPLGDAVDLAARAALVLGAVEIARDSSPEARRALDAARNGLMLVLVICVPAAYVGWADGCFDSFAPALMPGLTEAGAAMKAREEKKREELRAHHVATCAFDSVAASIDPNAPDAPAFFARASQSHHFAAWRRRVERLDIVAFRCGDDVAVFLMSDERRRAELGVVEWDFFDAAKWPAARALLGRGLGPGSR